MLAGTLLYRIMLIFADCAIFVYKENSCHVVIVAACAGCVIPAEHDPDVNWHEQSAPCKKQKESVMLRAPQVPAMPLLEDMPEAVKALDVEEQEDPEE